MSVFDDSTTGQENSDDQNTDTQNQEDWLNKVVAEKGDHWQDPQTLAKGYVHAQQRIKELEELTKKAEQNDYARELLEQLQAKQSAPAPTSGQPDTKDKGGTGEENTTRDPDELQALIDKALTERERTNTVQQNISQANSKLEEQYGTEAQKVVQDRAQELGMSMDRLKELAGESPTAFMRLMGEAPKKESNSIPQGTLNTAAGFTDGQKERNFRYYQELRRNNRSQYNSRQVQQQMFEDAKRLGDKFYQ